jgi:hypothetical protein
MRRKRTDNEDQGQERCDGIFTPNARESFSSNESFCQARKHTSEVRSMDFSLASAADMLKL